MTQLGITIVPTTQPKANRYINRVHRHHKALPGGFAWYCLAALVDGNVVGVAVAGRPTNRNNDDGQTVEVLRVATDGTPNAPSALLGAAARAARQIGARRCITYTLEEEGGASLRGAGWVQESSGIKSWWTHEGKGSKGTRTAAVKRDHHDKTKTRWAVHFRDSVEYDDSVLVEEVDHV